MPEKGTIHLSLASEYDKFSIGGSHTLVVNKTWEESRGSAVSCGVVVSRGRVYRKVSIASSVTMRCESG